ncbi:MAG: hypothetical protein K0U79_12120 [Gammaproteobacteria bacterium]|nr:hypothetical protein [Gammaproteobacteria bacterium]
MIELQPGGSAYGATKSAKAYGQRRRRSVRCRKLAEGAALFEHVHNLLQYWRWSPEQIARRSARMHGNEPEWRIRHETAVSDPVRIGDDHSRPSGLDFASSRIEL